ncbi:alpha/beta hydrolase [Leadbetterella byssophila]|uniref:alpha/beta hydrolase n=1 Tax=Leadbetterella byssophila TaxID=316068 RepID=UPI0039A08B2F
MKRILLLLFISFYVQAQKVDTVLVPSASMNKSIKNVVILPDSYDKESEFPVLYLLHGYSGNHSSWIKTKPELPQLASLYKMIIVCPDGQNSWYWDSPENPSMRYETYVSKELVGYMDQTYKTKKSPSGRAVTGLSMGGHGGLWLGIRNQNVFGACGSMSGGVDIRPFPNNWEMKKSLSELADKPENWENHTVINQLHKIQPGKLSIMIDCGTGDFFYAVNKALHEKLLYMNIPHDYTERPGVHNGDYWKVAIEYQMLYFSRFFKQ